MCGSDDKNSLAYEIVSCMQKKKLTLGAAESCTGGLFSSAIVNVPGASMVYEAGFITYANSAKHRLIGVKNETLERYGAVSRQTAEEMAEGTLQVAGTDYAVSITGIAGPDGGTKTKPVGLVYIGCGRKDHILVKECHFKGDRTQIRQQSVQCALELLWGMLVKEEDGSWKKT